MKVYPRETTEAFLDGHVSAFDFFGGIPLSILYDNTRLAVAKICGDGRRERTRAFTELQSHYLFRDRFGRPAKDNDKGKVGGLVKYVRANFMAPIPHVASFDELNAMLAERCQRRQNVIALGNSGTGKTHVALALGLAACQKGFTVTFTTAAALVHQLMEARDERRLLKLQRDLQAVKLMIVDELGYVPLSPTGAELLFEVFSQRYERGSTIITPNLPFEDWTSVLGSERLTGALLDRLTHHVHILTMNGDSYRLKQSSGRRRPPAPGNGAEQKQANAETVDPETGEIFPS